MIILTNNRLSSIALLLLLLLVAVIAKSQTAPHIMLSRNPLPAWINESPSQFETHALNNRKAANWTVNESVITTIQLATNAQYDYLQTGSILFNDEAGILANSIADTLLKKKPEIRKMLNIVVQYSSGTNSISYPNGFIVIQLGIFSQLENEDQLAFHISHEIAHFLNGDLAMQENPVKAPYFTPDVEQRFDFLKVREREADLLAYELYEDAGYEPSQVLRYFTIRERNWIVPTPLKFNPVFFNTPQYQFNDLESDTSTFLTSGYNKDDFEHTAHDHYIIRKNQIAEYYKLDSTNVSSKKPSLEFATVNRLAIYNCGLISLENRQTSAALYIGYYLSSVDSASCEEYTLLISKTLYLLSVSTSSMTSSHAPIEETDVTSGAKFNNLFDWVSFTPETEDQRGHVLGTNWFLSELDAIEISLLSVRWSWMMTQHSTKYSHITNFTCGTSISILHENIAIGMDTITVIVKSFDSANTSNEQAPTLTVRTSPDSNVFSQSQLLAIQEQQALYAEKLKQATTKGINIDSAMMPKTTCYSLFGTICADLFTDSAFRTFFLRNLFCDTLINAIEADMKADRMQSDTAYLLVSVHYWLKENKRANTFLLNNDKSEERSAMNRNTIHTTAKSRRIKLLSTSPLEPDTITLQDYNNYCIARRVYSECLESGSNLFFKPIAYKELADSIISKEHLSHAIIDIAVTKQYLKIRHPGLFVIGCIIPFTMPFVVGYALVPQKYTIHQTSVFNLRTGKTDWLFIHGGKGSGKYNDASYHYTKVFQASRKQRVYQTK